MKKITYNWKFWFKFLIGILPIIVIPLVVISMYIDYVYGDLIPTSQTDINNLYNSYDKELIDQMVLMKVNHQNFKLFFLSITRNILLITTLGNILFSIFFVSSAFNIKNEGKGKIDNFTVGFITSMISLFIVFFYNFTRIFDVSVSKWYGYVSWFCLHSVPQILGIIYFLVWYPISSFKDKKNYKTELILSTTIILGYMIFWLVVGLIMSKTLTYRMFSTMSASGYFPYTFLDVVSNTKKLYAKSLTNSMIVQLFVILICMELFCVGAFYSYKAIFKKKIYLYNKKNELSSNNEE